MTDELAIYETAALSIVEDMELDKVKEIMDVIDGAFRAMKEIKAKKDAALLEWIQANGEFEFGGNKYYVGRKKTVKCYDLSGCVESILSAAEGDWDEFVKSLSANAIKQAAAKTLLGEEEWKKYFDVKWKDTVELKKLPVDRSNK